MRCAVIGDPAEHSLSPAIHRAGYQLHGMDWSYEAITVGVDELDGLLRTLSHNRRWAGLSVTAPHKETILAHGTPDEPSALAGAGNTLIFGEDPRVHNTDVPGFVAALRHHGVIGLRRVAIVGAGATARSILLACASLGAREAELLVRNRARTQSIRRLAGALDVQLQVRDIHEIPEPVDLLASTVPATATAQYAATWVRRAEAIFDVVYDPWPTPLGQAGHAVGTLALSGLDLLAGQAVDQFHLLTGHRVTFELCRSAAEQELRRRQGL